MSKYKELTGRIHYGLFLAVVFLLPFPQLPLRYACVLWLISWVIEGRWLQHPTPLRENKMLVPFLLFGVWYAWEILSCLWAQDTSAWAAQIERYIAFGALVPIGIWGLNDYYQPRQIAKVLVLGALTSVPFYLLTLTLCYYSPSLANHFPLLPAAPNWLSFFQENISVFKHRLFLNSVLLLAIIAVFHLWWRKWVTIIVVTLPMVALIGLSGSRQTILTAVILAFAAIIAALPSKQRLRWGGLIGIALLLIGLGALKIHPRMQGFNIYGETRTILWQQALEHPSDYFWTGLGAGQDRIYLNSSFDSHNQYLKELMELGVFGLLLFLSAWISVVFCAQKKGRLTALFFVVLFACNMCTECMFGHFCGVALWAVSLLFISIQSDTAREQQSARRT